MGDHLTYSVWSLPTRFRANSRSVTWGLCTFLVLVLHPDIIFTIVRVDAIEERESGKDVQMPLPLIVCLLLIILILKFIKTNVLKLWVWQCREVYFIKFSLAWLSPLLLDWWPRWLLEFRSVAMKLNSVSNTEKFTNFCTPKSLI